MKTLFHIGVIIISTIFLLANFIFVIPSVLSIFDEGIKNIPIHKYYFADVLRYNKELGVLGEILFIGICLVVIWFNKWATKRINNFKK